MIQKIGIATKKPVKVNWFLWEGYSERHIHELEAWVESLGESFKEVLDISKGNLKVNTLEGSSYVIPNGYIIIRGVEGEYYPCDPEIFKKTYNIN